MTVVTISFSMQTVPDTDALRRLGRLYDTDCGIEKLPPHLQSVSVLSYFWRGSGGKLRLGNFGGPDKNEEAVLANFFELIEKHTPDLVTWGGHSAFMPILQHRAMIYGINAGRYFDTGERPLADSREFKWNNYLNRYHRRHLDLSDVLSSYSDENRATLDDMAVLCGLPGRRDCAGYPARADEICAGDAVRTELLRLRFCLTNGSLDADEYGFETERVRNLLKKKVEAEPYWQAFLAAWRGR